MLDPVAWIRENAFPGRVPAHEARIGLEVELLSLDADTHKPIAVQKRLLPFLVEWACERGGSVETGAKGAARVRMPGGGGFTIEPGGQLEYASPPYREPSRLIRHLDSVLPALVDAAADQGILLLGSGIDPFNAPSQAPLQLMSDRYCWMDAYFTSIGPAGRRMMRQTAAVQVNVDAPCAPESVWRTLNAAAPYFTALFANSRVYAGTDTNCVSYRAETWRQADPRRTGIFSCERDVVAEYAEFACTAPVMSVRTESGYAGFTECRRSGLIDDASWPEHLTTLFPEIRPKRYFEIRAIDAQPPEQLTLPVLICAGMLFDATAFAEANELLGTPDSELLFAAGRNGLANARLAQGCRKLVEIALGGCRRLDGRVQFDDIERAEARALELLNGFPASG
jgi:glutamate--cysteine ligase